MGENNVSLREYLELKEKVSLLYQSVESLASTAEALRDSIEEKHQNQQANYQEVKTILIGKEGTNGLTSKVQSLAIKTEAHEIQAAEDRKGQWGAKTATIGGLFSLVAVAMTIAGKLL